MKHLSLTVASYSILFPFLICFSSSPLPAEEALLKYYYSAGFNSYDNLEKAGYVFNVGFEVPMGRALFMIGELAYSKNHDITLEDNWFETTDRVDLSEFAFLTGVRYQVLAQYDTGLFLVGKGGCFSQDLSGRAVESLPEYPGAPIGISRNDLFWGSIVGVGIEGKLGPGDLFLEVDYSIRGRGKHTGNGFLVKTGVKL